MLVGTTGKGIGPTYTDKISRNGVRVGDILHNFEQKYAEAKARHEQILKGLNYEYDLTEIEKAWMEGIEYLKQFPLVDSEHEINNLLNDNKSVLCEGAQGTMLDIDFGSYPFVTSSNTICAGACTGLGVAPNKIGEVYGLLILLKGLLHLMLRLMRAYTVPCSWKELLTGKLSGRL